MPFFTDPTLLEYAIRIIVDMERTTSPSSSPSSDRRGTVIEMNADEEVTRSSLSMSRIYFTD
jgi:hypothetical protein